MTVIIGMVLLGSLLGLFSGLMPGIHCNTLAAILLASYPSLESAIGAVIGKDETAIAVCCCVVSAAVVHSFVDFVPSVFIGAPDSEDAVSVLPGHRMLLEGRGMAAVRAAAIGSLVGCCCAVALSIPFQYLLFNGAEPVLDKLTPVVVLIACMGILMNESRQGTLLWGSVTFALSGALGYACMTLPIPTDGLVGEGSLLFPLLTGLFGIPVLLESSNGRGILPPQRDDVMDPVGMVPGLKGVLMGSVAGWFPGITSNIGATMSVCIMPENRADRFVSTVASIGTVTSVLSLVVLSVNGGGRSGTAIVVGEIGMDQVQGFMSQGFLILMMATIMSAMVGYKMTIFSGKVLSATLARMDQRRTSRAVTVLLVALVLLLTGPWGLVVLIASVVIGSVPTSCGMGRTTLCGCLLLPVMLF